MVIFISLIKYWWLNLQIPAVSSECVPEPQLTVDGMGSFVLPTIFP
jgi:hypothetical protein